MRKVQELARKLPEKLEGVLRVASQRIVLTPLPWMRPSFSCSGRPEISVPLERRAVVAAYCDTHYDACTREETGRHPYPSLVGLCSGGSCCCSSVSGHVVPGGSAPQSIPGRLIGTAFAFRLACAQIHASFLCSGWLLPATARLQLKSHFTRETSDLNHPMSLWLKFVPHPILYHTMWLMRLLMSI